MRGFLLDAHRAMGISPYFQAVVAGALLHVLFESSACDYRREVRRRAHRGRSQSGSSERVKISTPSRAACASLARSWGAQDVGAY